MNKTYRLIWSKVKGALIVVSEIVSGKGGPSKVKTAAAVISTILLLSAGGAYALPKDGQVAAGQVVISTPSATQMNINQGTNQAIINWNSFGIAKGEAVNIAQPSSQSTLLNRVIGNNPSQIFGSLTAKGRVFLVNPGGVFFAPGASVNVGGLVASSLNIKDSDFLAGKYSFYKDGLAGSVINQGNISGGFVALLGSSVENAGNIVTTKGTTGLAAGDEITLGFDPNGLMAIKVDKAAYLAQVANSGVIEADSGTVVMTASAADALLATVVNNSGIVRARSMVERNGEIVIEGGTVVNSGSLDVSAPAGNGGSLRISATGMVMNTGSMSATGTQGGSIAVSGRAIVEAGSLDASGSASGGRITLAATEGLEQTAASTVLASGGSGQGGSIRAVADTGAYLSGTFSAGGIRGGDIALSASELTLAGAQVHADGAEGGGIVRVGGGWQGQASDLPNAGKTTLLSAALTANATQNGNGGEVALWSESTTSFSGSIEARGGAAGGNGGVVEVSSHGRLGFGGTVDVTASAGQNGSLLLDPKNITIEEGSSSGIGVIPLTYTSPKEYDSYGAYTTSVVELMNGSNSMGTLVVANSRDSIAASWAGAVRLYNMTTGALISTLTGSAALDQVGSTKVAALTNGNFVVTSALWSGGTSALAKGAATWGSGTTGISGVVSSSNSLTGSAAGDQVGTVVEALTNGNYVVGSTYWGNGKGAATWGSGTTGVKGEISSSNSLVGGTPGDQVGTYFAALTNGNYVTTSPTWGSGGVLNSGKGSITWGSGTAGISGVVSSSNSLVGGSAGDRLSYGTPPYTLSNGNYLVFSWFWSAGVTGDNSKGKGAVTWGSGTAAITGTLSSSNSLVGTKGGDCLGLNRAIVLSNGNYVVPSQYWSNGATSMVGAVTWGSGTTGVKGEISSSNSLIGSTKGDQVGSFFAALTNGNYVIGSANWDNGAVTNVGAATWGSGATGITGTVSTSNSLVGSAAGDQVGLSIYALTNGNYVVSSSYWGSGGVQMSGKGAATWGSGATGITGTVSTSNSLVGSAAGDQVGARVVPLTNGNYVVSSSYWGSGGVQMSGKGAATWGSGATGITGTVSTSNSLVGSAAGDQVGLSIYALTNGNYVVSSQYWGSGGTAANGKGAATWGSGTTGITGTVSSNNSLIGSTAGDRIGVLFVALTNGNYVVYSNMSANGAVASAGSFTWGNGTTGITGTVSASNSLVGSAYGDFNGSTARALSNGDYVLRIPSWDNGAITNAGAVTVVNGTTGITGTVSASSFFTGSTLGDMIGYSVVPLSNGTAVVKSQYYDGAGVAGAGRIDIVKRAAGGLASNLYSDSPTASSTLYTDDLTALLNAGTAVTLQANNDLTLNAALSANNTGGNGGALTFQAGRSILLNAAITTDNGNFTAIANDNLASGVVNANRDSGAAVITMAAGTSINAGSGAVSMDLRPGTGKTNSTSGDMTLQAITAGSLALTNAGITAGSDMIFNGAVTLTGALSATLASGSLSQSNALSVAGATTLAAGAANDITLNQSTNNFSTVGITSGKNVILTDSNALILAASTVSGYLIVTTAGAITQSGALSVTGATTLTAGANAVTLSNAGNLFTGAVNLSNTGANNLTLVNDRATNLGTVTTGGAFSLTSDGAVIQSGALTVTGVTTLAAGAANDINLVTFTNYFSTVGITSGKNVLLKDADALILGTSTVSGTLTVTTAGAITQSGALSVTGTSNLVTSGGANDITLTNAANNFTGAVRVLSDNSVSLTNSNALVLGHVSAESTVKGHLTAVAGGTITQVGALAVTGTTTLAAGTANDINLGTSTNNFGTVSITSGKNVSLKDADALILGASTVSGTLAVATAGAITQSWTLNVTGATTLAAGAANDINLATSNNSFSTVGITSGKNVSLKDADALILSASTVSGTLAVATAGAITQSGALSVTGATTLAAGAANSIGLYMENNNFSTVGITSGNNVSLRDVNALDLGASTVSGQLGVITAGAITQSGKLTVAGVTTLEAGAANNITLTTSTNNFGAVGITSGNNVSLADADALILGASTVSGTLGVATAGAITQGGALTVTGVTTLAAGAANDITLNTSTNNFGAVGITSGKNVSLTDSNALILGASTVSGTLGVATTGAITQSGALTVGGTTAITTTAAAVTLATAANNFTGAVSAATANGALSLADTDTLILGTVNTGTGSLTLSTGGAITQSGTVTVGGTTSITTTAAAVTLATAANNFTGAVSAATANGALSLADTDTLLLGTVNTGTGSLTLSTGGAITQSGTVTVGGTTSITTTADAVTLATAANNFTGAVSAATANGALSLADTNTLILGTVNTGTGSLTLSTGGAITQSGILTVGGATTVAAGANAVTLSNVSNLLTGAVTLSNTGANNLTLVNDRATNLGTVSTGGAFSLTSDGAVTQSGALTVTGVTTLAAGTANDITLATSTNNFSTVVITSGKNVSLKDANALILGASTVSGALGVTAAGAITQSGVLTVTGTTDLVTSGGANDITLTNAANNFTGGVRVVSDNSVSLTDANALVLGNANGTSTVLGHLTAVAGGTITQAGALAVTGTTTLTAGAANDITLTTSTNNFGTVVITSGKNVRLTDSNALILGASTVSGTLGVATTGAITQSGALSVTGATTLAAGTADINLATSTNNFSTVGITSGKNVSLKDADALILGASTVSGTLGVATTGAITQSGALAVTGVTTLAAGATNDITLATATNNFSTVGITTGNNVTLNDSNALILGASTVSGTLGVATAGAITQSGVLTVTGVTTLAAGAANDISLGTSTNNFSSVGITSGKDALLKDADALILGASTISGLLGVTAPGGITQSGALAVTGITSLVAGANDITLSNTGNNFTGALSVVSGKNIVLRDMNALGLGAVTSTGTVDAATLSNNLTLSGNISTSDIGNTAIVLNAGLDTVFGTATGGNIIISGSPSFTTGTGGRVLLYTGSVSGSTGLTASVGAGSGRFRYNSDEAKDNFTTALESGLHAIFREQPTVTVAAANQAVTYGTASAITYTLSGLQNGDTGGQAISSAPGLAVGGSTSTAGYVIAGEHTITPSGASGGLGYAMGYANGILTVGQKSLTLTIGGVSDKVYNGTTGITGTVSAAIAGAIEGDVVTTPGGSVTGFADKNVGSSKSVSYTGFTLSGDDAGNYSLTAEGIASSTASITAKAISVSGITAADKVYDGTTSATVNSVGAIFTGMIDGDALAALASGVFADKNVADGKKTVTLTSSYGGADKGNYTFTDQATTEASITAKAVTVSGITAADKVYDGNTTATLNAEAASFDGRVVSDVLTTAASGAFSDKNVASSKTVSISGITLGGADKGNYSLTGTTASATASITPKSLTLAGAADVDKTYDGTTVVTAATPYGELSGVVTDDTVSVAGAPVYSSKDAGARDLLQGSVALWGADGGNYALSWTKGSGTINQAALSMTANDAYSIVFDSDPSFTAKYSGFVNGETATVLTSPIVTRTGSDTVAGTYTDVLVPSAISSNYTITPVPGSFTIVPVDTLLIRLADSTKVYGSELPSLTAIDAKYCLSGYDGSSSIRTVTLTKNADNSYAYNDGNSDTGTFQIITDATATTNVGNAIINAGSITRTGIATNFKNQQTQAGNLSITQLGTLLSVAGASKTYDGTTAVSAATITITNKVGSNVVSATGSGVYASKSVGTNLNYSISNLLLGGAQAGNYYLAASSVDGTDGGISAKSITASYIAQDKVYDGSLTATVSGSSSGVVGGDAVSFSQSSALFGDKVVGTGKGVAISGITLGGSDGGNYVLAANTASATANITPRAVTISGITGVDKIYNGTRAATVNTGAVQFNNQVTGDTLTVSASGLFADKNVGDGKTVTLTSTYDGADKGNYTFTDQATASAKITPLGVSVSGITAENKIYDGILTATVSGAAANFAGKVEGDALSVTATGAFANKNVGTGKTVALASSYSGSDAGNYSFTGQATTTADITAKAITVSGITAADKVYDRTTGATVSVAAAQFAGKVADDALSVTATGAFADKNAGTGKTVNLSSTYDGADKGNYTFTSQSTTTANISPKAASVSGLSADNKEYDGTRSATVSASSAVLTGVFENDTVAVGATGLFSDKNAGTGKTVALTSTYDGAEKGNYTFTDQANASANITPKAITLEGITAADKVYDGGSAATGITTGATLTGMIAGDNLTVSASGLFADKNVESGKTVTLTNTLGGSDLSNYTITKQASATASITPKEISISGITAADKVYDGGTNAVVNVSTASISGLIGGDDLSVLGTTSGAFANKNVESNKTVALDIKYDGTDKGNYTVNIDKTTTTASISPKAITLEGITAEDKVYDGGTSATAIITSAAFTGMIKDDKLTVSASGLFADKNVGSSKNVTLTNTLGGDDLSNYTITQQQSASASISPKAITLEGITAEDKVYDGGRTATAITTSAAFTGKIADDNLTLSASGLFADKNVGSSKNVTLTNTLGGSDLSNYTITQQESATASITQKEISITGITAANKVYDGVKDAVVDVSTASISGLIGGDDLSVLNTTSGAFVNKNVGTGKTVNLAIKYGGTDADNYKVKIDQTTTTASITPKAITLSGIIGVDKIYDGGTSATAITTSATFTGMIEGDKLTVAASGQFADRNVGSGKNVTLTNILGGDDVGNYTITKQESALASISPKAITLEGITAENKVYDGGISATAITTGAAFTGKITGDNLTVSASGLFIDKNVGSSKNVTLTNTLGGSDLGNYTITQQESATAGITPKAITLTGITAEDKVYDGGRAATGITTGAAFTGMIAGDNLTVSASGLFADKNVGSGKSVTLSNTLGGNDLSNYTITKQESATAKITPKAITLEGIIADDKVYDGGTTATANINGATFTGMVAGDNLTVAASGQFADKYLGSGKSVTLTNTLGGSDLSNYTITQQESTLADITTKTITLSGITAASKVYDGSTSATTTTTGAAFNGIIEGDNLTVSASGLFSDKNAATGKTVTLTSSYGGTDIGNYNFNDQVTTTADITPKDITLAGFSAANKIYDSTTAATITGYGQLSGVLLADASSVIAGSGSAVFSDANVGTGKTVTGSGFNISGSEAGNHKLTTTTLSNTADITRRPLTITADAKQKTAGQVDPPLTYQSEAFSAGRGLFSGETLLGYLTRVAGETSGAYPIKQGTVDNATNNNYDIAFVSADLTVKTLPTSDLIPRGNSEPPPATNPAIIVAPPTLPTPGADGKSAGSIVIGAEGSSNSASGKGGKSGTGGFTDTIPLSIAQSVATAFIYPIPENTFSHSNVKAVITLEARLADGSELPAWMSFDPSRRVITGTPPIGVAGEFQIRITARDQFGAEAQTSLKITVGI